MHQRRTFLKGNIVRKSSVMFKYFRTIFARAFLPTAENPIGATGFEPAT